MKETIYQTDDVKVMLEWGVDNSFATPSYDIQFKLSKEISRSIRTAYEDKLIFQQYTHRDDTCKDPTCWLHEVPHYHSHSSGRMAISNEVTVPDPTNIDINDYIPFKIDLPPFDMTKKKIGIDCKIMVVPI